MSSDRKRPRILILIPTFQPNDAVGNDVLGMYHTLRGAGYDTTIFAQFIHPAHARITTTIYPGAAGPWNDPEAILIYHHAIDWDLGEQILAKSRNKIVIKYHNVTPPNFYTRYAEHYYWACVKGIQATERLAKLPHTWIWGDSQYNTQEFINLGVGADRCRVLPPMHRIEDLAGEPFDAVVTGAYRDHIANILFVGGIRPNKGHAKALEVFSAYKQITDTPARLLFVGNYDANLKSYMDELQECVAKLDLYAEEDVVFATSVSPAQLRAYYMMASVFLCVSEHEGFCVPLVEAMSFRVPIVAWGATAVGETAGDSGWIAKDYDPAGLASATAEIIDNPALARSFAARGRERYEAFFHTDAIKRKLLELVSEVAQ